MDEEAAQPETVEPELTEAEAPDDQIPDDLIAEEPPPEEAATDGVDPVAEASHPDEPTSAEPEHEPAPERAPETAPQLDPEPDPEPVQETDPLSAVQAALEDAGSTESELEFCAIDAKPGPRRAKARPCLLRAPPLSSHRSCPKPTQPRATRSPEALEHLRRSTRNIRQAPTRSRIFLPASRPLATSSIGATPSSTPHCQTEQIAINSEQIRRDLR